MVACIHAAVWTPVSKEEAQADKLPGAERDALLRNHRDAGDFGYPRAYLGTQRNGAAALVLRDAKGRTRLWLAVAADGTPAVEVMDENGRVSKSLTAEPQQQR
jgi:hypothetical protein